MAALSTCLRCENIFQMFDRGAGEKMSGRKIGHRRAKKHIRNRKKPTGDRGPGPTSGSRGSSSAPCPPGDTLGSCPLLVASGAAQMSEREGRKFFFLLQAILAALFLIVGVALAIEAASGGYGIGLLVVSAMANEAAFFILAALFAATAMHLRP